MIAETRVGGASSARAPAPSALRAGLAVGYGILVLALVAPTLVGLHGLWIDSFTYSHGYLIVAISVWLMLLALRDHPIARWRPRPSVWGLLALLACITGILAGRATDTLIVPDLLLPPLLFAALWAAVGGVQAAPFAAPIAYLYFALPVWDLLTSPLQQLTVVVVSAWVRGSTIPALIEGNLIHIPSGTFEVAGGCSGLHFFIVALALAALYGLLYYARWLPRILLVLVAAGLALVTNWLRVFTLVAVGHLTDMQHFLITVDHYWFGWGLFLIVIAPLLFLARWLERGDQNARSERNDRPERSIEEPPSVRQRSRAGMAIFAAAGLAIVVGVVADRRVAALGADVPDAAAPVALAAPSGWSFDREWADARRPIYRGPGSEDAAWYSRDGGTVGVYFAHYPVQSQGREVVFFANRPQGGAARVVGRATREVRLVASSSGRGAAAAASAPAGLALAELEVVDPGASRRLVWYTLRVAGRSTTSEVVAKALQALGAVAGRADAQVYVATAVCGEDCGAARQSLEEVTARAAARLFQCADLSVDAGADAPRSNEGETC